MRNICAFIMDLMHQPKADTAQESHLHWEQLQFRSARITCQVEVDILKITNCKILVSANFCETQNQIWIQILTWHDFLHWYQAQCQRIEVKYFDISAWHPQGTELLLPFQYRGVGLRGWCPSEDSWLSRAPVPFSLGFLCPSDFHQRLKGENNTSFLPCISNF